MLSIQGNDRGHMTPFRASDGQHRFSMLESLGIGILAPIRPKREKRQYDCKKSGRVLFESYDDDTDSASDTSELSPRGIPPYLTSKWIDSKLSEDPRYFVEERVKVAFRLTGEGKDIFKWYTGTVIAFLEHDHKFEDRYVVSFDDGTVESICLSQYKYCTYNSLHRENGPGNDLEWFICSDM